MAHVKTLFLAISLVALAAVPQAQVSAPNAAGVAMSHLHFQVADVEANRLFWVALGGAPSARRGDVETVAFPGLLIQISRGTPAGPAEGSVVAHVAMRVKTFAQIEARGITVERRRIEGRESGMAIAPSGDRVELFEENAEQVRFRPEAGKSTASAERHNRPMTAPVEPHHLHLNVPTGADVAAQNWYVEHFGGVPGIRLRYPAADVPGMNFNFSGVATATAPTRGRTLDHIGFEVKNLAAFVRTLTAAGVRFEQPYTAGPGGSGSARLVDPWGTAIELTEGQ